MRKERSVRATRLPHRSSDAQSALEQSTLPVATAGYAKREQNLIGQDPFPRERTPEREEDRSGDCAYVAALARAECVRESSG